MAYSFIFILILSNFLISSESYECYQHKQCKKSKYRSTDGSCNNFQNPNWGKSMTAYNRLLPAAFSDGKYEPRKSVSEKTLPDPRLLSRTFFMNHEENDKLHTMLSMQFGQFISHDQSHIYKGDPDPANPTCCNSDFTHTLSFEKDTNVHCMALSLKKDDPMRFKHGQGCMDFSRGETDKCAGDKAARTLSGPTHFLDGSNIYGIDEDTAKQLREMAGGRLRTNERHDEWPPNKDKCPFKNQEVCFMAGDPERCDQTLGLASLHVLLLREHNRVARKLEEMNRHWSDEVLFQEARRIVIGEYQHIAYNEWIGEYIGKRRAKELGLFDENDNGHTNRYDPFTNPSVLTEHANGAMRAFHSNIKGRLRLYSERLKIVMANYDLNKFTFNPEVLTERNNFEYILLGLASQPKMPTGPYHSKAMTEELFRRDGGKFGFDLKALDILRERSEGIQGYNYYRELCGLKFAENFEDLRNEIDEEWIDKLKMVYEDPDDIDLTIGGLLENKLPHCELGPTNLCIFARHFNNTRNGDRYFYDRGDYEGAFSPAQLSEIKKATISRILCDNTKITKIQKSAFEVPGIHETTLRLPCSMIPEIDLTPWKEIDQQKMVFGNNLNTMFWHRKP